MIEIKNLNFLYNASHPPILKDINLHLPQGEYVAIIGPNGCGKTTLIRHLNALLVPTAGEVWVDGLDTRDGSSVWEIRRRVGMIFQQPDNQIVGMSVAEDVAFGPGNLGLPPGEVRRRVGEALSMVGLTGFEDRLPYSLSGGQKQLLAIAGLLAMEPRIIVLDEPTSSLDPAGKAVVLSILQKLRGQGMSIIHVTHNMDEAARADRIVVMDRGEIIADASAPDILSRVEWLRELGLAPPQVTELMWSLQRAGVSVEKGVIAVGEAVQAIIDLLEAANSPADGAISGKVVKHA